MSFDRLGTTNYEKLKSLGDEDFAVKYRRERLLLRTIEVALVGVVMALVLSSPAAAEDLSYLEIALLALATLAGAAAAVAGFRHLAWTYFPNNFAPLSSIEGAYVRVEVLASNCHTAKHVSDRAKARGRELYLVDWLEMEHRYTAQILGAPLTICKTPEDYRYSGPTCSTYAARCQRTEDRISQLHSRRMLLYSTWLHLSLAAAWVSGAYALANSSFVALLVMLLANGSYIEASWGRYFAFGCSPYAKVTSTRRARRRFNYLLRVCPAMRQVRDEVLASGRPLYVFDLDEAVRRDDEERRATSQVQLQPAS